MGSVDDLVLVKVVVAAEDDVDETSGCFVGKFDVARFAGVSEGDDDVGTSTTQIRDECFCGF